jgi:hypothetical protein
MEVVEDLMKFGGFSGSFWNLTELKMNQLLKKLVNTKSTERTAIQ